MPYNLITPYRRQCSIIYGSALLKLRGFGRNGPSTNVSLTSGMPNSSTLALVPRSSFFL
jgi:hypothetical protein